MKECDICDALTNAEKACRLAIVRAFGYEVNVYRFANPGETDCAVFDIGYSYTGDLNVCRAESLHWRGTLELFNREHDALQRMVMRLIDAFPVNDTLHADDDAREESNVLLLRIAPESNAVGSIGVEEVSPKNGGAPVQTYTCKVAFDVVFAVRF